MAKGRGRNRVALSDDDLRSRTRRLLVLERQLRQAIEQQDVGFAYQPMIEISSGRVVGGEALLRLGGDIGMSAVEVVAAAEHSGLMGALGVLVLQGVTTQLGGFLGRTEDDHFVMINLSATQLADEDLRLELARMVANDAIAPGRIAIEVPELVIRHHRAELDRLIQLVRPKFRVGIDGFGTGALTPELLDAVPFDYLKIHRNVTASLVGTADEQRTAELVDVIGKARARGIDVIGLGVENEAQSRALLAMGCDLAQGFLYAGSVTADHLLRLVDDGVPPSGAGRGESG